ncbi:MAG: hypothetical protein PF569_06530 [Candidatus Woesearchaeota archaeon]|jgi:hypothetical protein|nr:hypothetical protein [Candidatus Woesearchaeota archaeon]
MLKELKENIETLESIDAEVKVIKDEMNKKIDQLKKDKEYNNILASIDDQKSILTDEAIKNFKETGEKTYIGGIKVQERTTQSIVDKKKAMDFALDKKLFLKLDEKAILKFSKDNDLDFVKEDTNTIATFPKTIILEG